jgi:hypothetical protein
MKNGLNWFVGLSAAVVLSFSMMTRRADAALSAGATQLPLGKNCTVQLRRGDALGVATTGPIAPLTGSFNGGETAVSGKLHSANDEWVVIEGANNSLLWIPKRSILLVQAPKQ